MGFSDANIPNGRPLGVLLLLLLFYLCGFCVSTRQGPEVVVVSESISSLEENESIQRFREYLRIRTVQPEPDYASAVRFLRRQADEIGLDVTVIELVEKKPICLMTWVGSEPSLPSILLNSHMDVVPVTEDMWKYDPFAAFIDEGGNIYARGTQDMKGQGMHYLEAIRILKLQKGFRPVRTIRVIFVPDEEIGAADGWGIFINSHEFASLNVGIALDEGPFHPDNNGSYMATYAEKSPWWLVIKAVGDPGHGSVLYDGSALGNLFKSIESITCFRDSQWNLVKAGADSGDVVTVNGVFLKAGTPTGTNTFTMNIQPAEAQAGFDIRVPPNDEVASALERRIAEEWAPSSRNLSFWFEQKFETDDGHPAVTKIGKSNPWWVLLEETLAEKVNADISANICTASTDMRFLRQKQKSAFGFTALKNTPSRVHEHNEFVNGWEWLRGIHVYKDVIEAYSCLSETGVDSRSGFEGDASAHKDA